MKSELVDFLGKVSLFSDIDRKDLSDIAASGTELNFCSGDLICSRGDSGKSMFVITSGIVEVFVEVDSNRQILTHLHRGDYFGEMSLLSGLPRSASVRSLGTTSVFGLTKDSFEELCRNNVNIALEVIKVLSTRLAASNLASSSFDKARVYVVLSMDDAICQTEFATSLSIALGNEKKGVVTLYDPNFNSEKHAEIFGVNERKDIALELLSSGQLAVKESIVSVAENTGILAPQSKGGPVIQEFHHHIPFQALCQYSDFIVVDSSSTMAAVNREIIKSAEAVILMVPGGCNDLKELLSQFDRMVLTPASVEVSKVKIIVANDDKDSKISIPFDLKARTSLLPDAPELTFDESFFGREYGRKVKELALGFLNENFVELFIPLDDNCDLDYISSRLDQIKDCCPEMVKVETLSRLPASVDSSDDITGEFVVLEGVFAASDLKEKMNVLVKTVEDLKEQLGSGSLFLKIDGRVTKI